MSPWHVMLGYVVLISVFSVSSVISLILLFRKRKNKFRKNIIRFIISVIFLSLTILFICSHKTYYKYNDWVILRNTIYQVQEMYGEFDIGTIVDGQCGLVGYYIYTDNGPIMPDHLDHFYYIEYDEQGMILRVYNGCSIGG